MMKTIAEANQDIAFGLSNNLARLLREFSRDFERRIYSELLLRGYTEIRASHIAVFANLGLGAVRITELAERARVTQQAMGKMLKEIERLGYVSRDVDSGDKRAREIRLTVRGMQLALDSLEAHRKVYAYYAGKIGQEPLQQLEDSLREAVSKLELDYLPESWTATSSAP
tara:strand:+ start:9936 stop:10445 length:510 start_codon:yes stop_codon:yes gene_type:complete